MRFKLIYNEKNFIDKRVFTALAKYLQQSARLTAELSFVSEEEIQRLNKEFREIDKVTDVLSFPSLDGIKGVILKKEDFPFDVEGGRICIGSLAICVKRAEEQAAEYGNTFKRESTFLTLHGLLHLFGYDHVTEEGEEEMFAIQKEIMKKLGYEK